MPSANRSRIPVLTKIIPAPLPTVSPTVLPKVTPKITPDAMPPPLPAATKLQSPPLENAAPPPNAPPLTLPSVHGSSPAYNPAAIDVVALADEAVQKVMPALLAEFQMKLRRAVQDYVKAALQKEHE